MRLFILTLFGSGVLLALIFGFVLLKKNNKLENTRKLLKEKGVNSEASVVNKKFEKTRRIIHVTGRLQNFDSFLLKLRFNAKAKPSGSGPAISFNKALKGEDSVVDLTTDFIEFPKDVGEEMYNAVKIGDKVPIVFLAENPSDFEVLNSEGTFMPNYLLWMSIGSFVFSILSLIMFIQYFKTGTTI